MDENRKTESVYPLVMDPSFRSGEDTPWGGRALRDRFGKDAPEGITGESLEVSALPGHESRVANGIYRGKSLQEVFERWGERLTGKRERVFPLMLKLLDAEQCLSVQVHPDDRYAMEHEGKAGKSEAWYILDAEPGARLVYGIRPGYGLDELRELCRRGAAVEEALNTLPVKAGDVVYIPSGTVHAIGAGILLYEIQQSSDVTYRFYDWDRKDEHGRGRELHLDKALDVTRPDIMPNLIRPRLLHADRHGKLERVLYSTYFAVDGYSSCVDMPLSTDRRRFGILTALEDGSMLVDGEFIPLKAGQTAMIPAEAVPIALMGPSFLYAYPQVRGKEL